MKNKDNFIIQTSKEHFGLRAKKYNSSAKWIDDKKLIDKMVDLADVKLDDRVLDIAVGTGIISKAFHKRVKCVVGVDIATKMMEQAQRHTDELVLCNAEKMPFDDMSFDACICRQGLQFMDVDKVMSQIFRLLKSGGRVVLCHLTAHDKKDSDTAFLIQKLRNPARKNFFIPDDFITLLKKHNFSDIELHDYISVESVNRWIDNGAIDEAQKEKIRDAYRHSSDEFKKIHSLKFTDGDILDSMKMVIVKALKK